MLVILLPGPLLFPEVMGIAQGMDAAVLVVRLPVIMTQYALEEGQDAYLIHGLGATFCVGIDPGQ